MKNYLDNVPVLETSKLTTFGQISIVLGFFLAVAFVALDAGQVYRQLAIISIAVGFPTLLAGLVCDTLIRIHNAKVRHYNSES